jgi:hypothetical protein
MRYPKVSFGVVSVVVEPFGDGRARHAAAEHVRAQHHRHRGEETTQDTKREDRQEDRQTGRQAGRQARARTRTRRPSCAGRTNHTKEQRKVKSEVELVETTHPPLAAGAGKPGQTNPNRVQVKLTDSQNAPAEAPSVDAHARKVHRVREGLDLRQRVQRCGAPHQQQGNRASKQASRPGVSTHRRVQPVSTRTRPLREGCACMCMRGKRERRR